MVLFDAKNTPLYLPIGSRFDTLEEFEQRYAMTVQTAITNGPALVEGGVSVLQNSAMDSSQRNVRATRAMLGWKGYFVYLVVVRSATLPETAAARRRGDGGGAPGRVSESRRANGGRCSADGGVHARHPAAVGALVGGGRAGLSDGHSH
jgi:hypothetical protein